jgi:MoxR-like ATPase
VKDRVEAFAGRFQALGAEIGKIMVGQAEMVNEVLMALVAGGHVLLEGVPGLGKTLLVKTLGQCLDMSFARIQFTPDLMPADISGTNLVEEVAGARAFRFAPGPVFAHLVLADEINRATPKTQSALLEAMAERHVTVMGTTHKLPDPFFVMATQNPIEMEGTYPLPEAQVDRFFFKVWVEFPDLAEMMEILERTTGTATAEVKPVCDPATLMEMHRLCREVVASGPVKEYAARLVLATHPERADAPADVRRYLRFGASPRGAQSLLLAAKVRALTQGRFNLAFEDVQAVALPALRHRLILSFEGEAEGFKADTLLQKLVAELPTGAAIAS